MEDSKLALIFADPPYNIGFQYNQHQDKMSEKEYAEFCNAWLDSLPKCNKIIITPGPRNVKFYPPFDDIGTWHKPNSSSGASAFHFRTCEPILFYGKFSDKKRMNDFFEYSRSIGSVLNESWKSANVEDGAPAKPIKLLGDFLSSWTQQGDVVFDPFLGSGSTLIACEQSHRTCLGIELDAKYCDAIIARWETLTGKKATLLK